MISVDGDGIKQFFIGVLTQVGKRWEVGWHRITTTTAAYICYVILIIPSRISRF